MRDSNVQQSHTEDQEAYFLHIDFVVTLVENIHLEFIILCTHLVAQTSYEFIKTFIFHLGPTACSYRFISNKRRPTTSMQYKIFETKSLYRNDRKKFVSFSNIRT